MIQSEKMQTMKMLRFDAIYLGDGLKLAVGVMNQVHQGTDGSRGVKVICQSLKHTGFSLSQPETASSNQSIYQQIK